MINPTEFRFGNYLLQKINNRILPVKCNASHFELMLRGEVKDLFPVMLKAEILLKCGFAENEDYPLRPEAQEFKMLLPVIGKERNEICAYIKNNKECFARATVNGLPASNNFFHLHQLQNLYLALTGEEMEILGPGPLSPGGGT